MHHLKKVFKSNLQQHLDSETINILWDQLLLGIAEQEKIEQNKMRHKAINSHYDEIAIIIAERGLLDVPGNKTPALWSGGSDVYRYAHKIKGCVTLEKTPFGSALLKISRDLHPNFKIVSPLWNAISGKFVARLKTSPRIFARTFVPNSVLFRKEIPAIPEDLLPQCKYHALYGDNIEDIQEINDKGDLTKDYAFNDPKIMGRTLKYRMFTAEKNTSKDMHSKQETICIEEMKIA